MKNSKLTMNYQDYELLIDQILKNSLNIEQIERLSPSEIETFKRTLIDYLGNHGRIDKNDVCYLYHELIKNKSNIVLKTTTSRTMIETLKQQQGISPEINQFFSQKDFTILEELGRNSFAGRVTSKARHNKTGEIVVIKQFQFLSANWDGYKLVQKEIETLSKLDHPNIPKFLGQYEDEQGFYLVQEYIDAASLANYGQLEIEEVTEIALSVLDILAYLQKLSPPVFHRDIKPENILYNKQTKQVYLVDFGVAKTGVGTNATSTINGGTLGFMPPEQLLGQKLNQSSDLYSLGLTLICLLGGISSGEISQFLDHKFEIDFSKAIPNDINWKFRDYLRQLIYPDHSKRFKNAELAQQALWYLREIEFSLFISENHQKLDRISFSDVLFTRKTFFHVSLVTIGTIGIIGIIGIAYYLVYPSGDLIITVPENPNIDLVAFKDMLLNLINITGVMGISIFISFVIIKVTQGDDFDYSAFVSSILLAFFLFFAKIIIETAF